MDHIEKAVQILQDGGIVIIPTDTAFGISCRIDNEEAVKRLFTLRKRPVTKATPVLVSGISMAQEYLLPISPEVNKQLLTPYWPGALTVVLPCQTKKVPDLVRGGGDNLGVRMPNHEIALEIITQVGVPILAPSANFHGEQTPYTFADLNPELTSLVDYVVPGVCSIQQASTVIDATRTPWKILRQGAVNIAV